VRTIELDDRERTGKDGDDRLAGVAASAHSSTLGVAMTRSRVRVTAGSGRKWSTSRTLREAKRTTRFRDGYRSFVLAAGFRVPDPREAFRLRMPSMPKGDTRTRRI
jgi:hypothetical protein